MNNPWHFACKRQQFVFIGVQNVGETMEQLFRRTMAVAELVILELRKVCKPDVDFRCKSTQREPTIVSKLPKSLAKGHLLRLLVREDSAPNTGCTRWSTYHSRDGRNSNTLPSNV